MRQLIQDVRNGRTSVREIRVPIMRSHHVVMVTVDSCISAGTERYVVDLACKSLIGKARQRPDQVRRVLQKFRSEGIAAPLTQVSTKLDEPMPLN